MTWLLGIFGWGTAALIGAALVLGWAISRKALLILAAIAAALLVAWGWAGYARASSLQVKLDAQIAATKTAVGERDKARSERAAALATAETCSASVAALAAAADARGLAAEPARKAAAGRMHTAQQRANAQLAAPPSVPGDDAASAQDRAWRWLENRDRTE